MHQSAMCCFIDAIIAYVSTFTALLAAVHDQLQGGNDGASLLQHGTTGSFMLQVTFINLRQLTEQTRQMSSV